MAATYDAAVLDVTTPGKRNRVRLYAQDNAAGRMKLDDAEVDLFIGEEKNLFMAAARAAETVAGRTGNVASKSVGGLSISYGAQYYAKLAASLRSRGSLYQTPTAGGISVAEKTDLAADTDRPAPDARRGIHDNPATPTIAVSESGRFK